MVGEGVVWRGGGVMGCVCGGLDEYAEGDGADIGVGSSGWGRLSYG